MGSSGGVEMIDRILVTIVWFWGMILPIGIPITWGLSIFGVLQREALGYLTLGWIGCTVLGVWVGLIIWVTTRVWYYILTGRWK